MILEPFRCHTAWTDIWLAHKRGLAAGPLDEAFHTCVHTLGHRQVSCQTLSGMTQCPGNVWLHPVAPQPPLSHRPHHVIINHVIILCRPVEEQWGYFEFSPIHKTDHQTFWSDIRLIVWMSLKGHSASHLWLSVGEAVWCCGDVAWGQFKGEWERHVISPSINSQKKKKSAEQVTGPSLFNKILNIFTESVAF